MSLIYVGHKVLLYVLGYVMVCTGVWDGLSKLPPPHVKLPKRPQGESDSNPNPKAFEHLEFPGALSSANSSFLRCAFPLLLPEF